MFKLIDKSNWNTNPNKFQAKDWKLFMGIKKILTTFFQITKHFKENATTNIHSVLWEAVI